MNHGSQPGQTQNSDDPLEFELIDVDAARAAHDALPPGVDRLSELLPQSWDSRRRKPLPTDRALTGATIDWLLALPLSIRPITLCDRLPRVANLLAATWGDLPARAAMLDSLLNSSRRGRIGFPVDIQREIEALPRA
jgi:hypothetical protein